MGVGSKCSDSTDTELSSTKLLANFSAIDKMPQKIKEGAYFLVNKHYPYARLAQWGTGKWEVGTYEIDVHLDQLWKIEESETVACGYYIKNLAHETYRLTQFKGSKWDQKRDDVGNYAGQYYADQIWKFKKEGEYYRIYNHEHKNNKLTKWGKDDD